MHLGDAMLDFQLLLHASIQTNQVLHILVFDRGDCIKKELTHKVTKRLGSNMRSD